MKGGRQWHLLHAPGNYVVRVRCITTYNHDRRRITTDWYSWQAAYAEGDEQERGMSLPRTFVYNHGVNRITT